MIHEEGMQNQHNFLALCLVKFESFLKTYRNTGSDKNFLMQQQWKEKTLVERPQGWGHQTNELES
jgi:hypothetical protein